MTKTLNIEHVSEFWFFKFVCDHIESCRQRYHLMLVKNAKTKLIKKWNTQRYFLENLWESREFTIEESISLRDFSALTMRHL